MRNILFFVQNPIYSKLISSKIDELSINELKSFGNTWLFF